MLSRLCRLLAATVLAAAGSTAVAASPASAASCSTATGVTVVVDFHELGGGVQEVCDAGGGGRYAAPLFTESGFSLDRVQREPGFVCRVNNAPSPNQESCVSTPPPDAYWGLWWSNGTSGAWTYASAGVDSQKIPAGGSVALSWNGSSTKSPPRTTPPSHPSSPAASPTPTPPSPSASPSSGPRGGATGHATGHATGSASGNTHSGGTHPGSTGSTTGRDTASTSAPTASAAPSARALRAARVARAAQRGEARKHDRRALDAVGSPRHKASAPPSDSASASASTSAAAAQTTAVSADRPRAGGDAPPGWLAPAGIAGLFAAAAGIALVRRRRGVFGP